MDKLLRISLIALAMIALPVTLLPQERAVCAGNNIYAGDTVGVFWPLSLHTGPVNIYLWKSGSVEPEVLVANYCSEIGHYSWHVAESDTSKLCRIIIGSRSDSVLTTYPASYFRIIRSETLQKKSKVNDMHAERFEMHLYPNPIKNDVLQLIVNEVIKSVKIIEKASGRVLYDRASLSGKMCSVGVSEYPAGGYIVIATLVTGHQLIKSFVVVK